MKLSFTPDQLRKAYSGQYNKELASHGYEPYRVSRFGDYEYVLVSVPFLRPGRQTAEVINLTRFNAEPSNFKIPVDGQGFAWLAIDEGIAALTEYTPDDGSQSIWHEFIVRHTAVLTYNVSVPTREDLEATMDEMEAAMDAGGIGWGAPIN